MAYTIPPFPINSSTWTDYIVQTNCKRIVVSEQLNASADYFANTKDKAGNMTAANFKSKRAGDPFEITGSFDKGDVPFSLKSASLSPTFDGIELP